MPGTSRATSARTRVTAVASGDRSAEGLHAHLDEARAMVAAGTEVLGRPPADLAEVLTDLAVGGPAQCALRMICSVTRLDAAHGCALANAAWLGGAFRHYFNAPEVTAVIEDGGARRIQSGRGVVALLAGRRATLCGRQPASGARRARPCAARLARPPEPEQRPATAGGSQRHRVQARRGLGSAHFLLQGGHPKP